MVAFTTAEDLVPGDVDGRANVYVRRGGAPPALLTPGSAAAPGVPEWAPGTVRVLATGAVAFLTAVALLPADGDAVDDLYVATADGGIVLGSDDGATGADPALPATGLLASEDGSSLVFTTKGALVPSDTFADVDGVYRFRPGPPATLVLVTRDNAQGVATGVSADGTRVFWESSAPQGSASNNDGGGVDLFVGQEPFGSPRSPTWPFGNRGSATIFAGASPGADTVVLRTTEPFGSEGEIVDSVDLFAFRPESALPQRLTTSVGGGPAEDTGTAPQVVRVCEDGTVVFTTAKRVVAADADDAVDLYARSATSTTLLSAGLGAQPVEAVATSDDCTEAVWATSGRETADDADDAAADLFYGRGGGPVTLVTRVPAGGSDGAVTVTGPPTRPGAPARPTCAR